MSSNKVLDIGLCERPTIKLEFDDLNQFVYCLCVRILFDRMHSFKVRLYTFRLFNLGL